MSFEITGEENLTYSTEGSAQGAQNTNEDAARTGQKGERYDGSFNGEAYGSVGFQNVNQSVRVDDAFMEAATAKHPEEQMYALTAVTTGEVVEHVNARDLLMKVAEGTHVCGDPGLQYDGTIQQWHTAKNTGVFLLAKGSRVLTPDGYALVEDMTRGRITVGDGTCWSQARVRRIGPSTARTVVTSRGHRLKVAAQQALLTTAGDTVLASRAEGAELPWCLPLPCAGGDSKLRPTRTGASGKSYAHCSPALMLALGFLSGDGTIAGDKTVVYFTPEKDGDFVREEVLPVLSDLAGDEGEVDYMPAPSGTSSAYELCRVGLSRWLVDIGMDTRPLPERRLPPFVWRAKLGAQRAFLRGLYAANGCVIHTARQAVNLTSTCAGLLRDVQLLLAVFGIRGTIRVQNKAQEIAWSNGTYRSKEAYRLEITAWSDIFRFARLIGFPQSVQEAKLRKIIDLGPLTSRYGGETRQATLEVASGEVNAAEVYAVIVTDCTRLMVDGVLLQSMPARPGAAPGLVRNGKELPFNPDRPPVPPSGPRRAT